MWTVLRKFGSLGVAGAIVGAVVASLLAPSTLSWYYTPGSGGQAICNYSVLVPEVIGAFVRAQLIGAAAGAVLWVVVGVLVTRARRAKAHPVATPAPPAPPPAAAPQA